jgi:YVTN family beta-propeller protein/YD repeat-containing protein
MRSYLQERDLAQNGLLRAVTALLLLCVLVTTTGSATALASFSSSPQGGDSYVAFPSTTLGNDGSVEALDSVSGQVVGSALTVGVNPGSIAVDEPASDIVVANSGDSVHSDTTASVISTSSWSVTSTVTGLPSGWKPSAAMDVRKSLALIVDNAADDVSVISMSGSSPTLVGNLSLGVSGGQPLSIAVSPDGMYAYVTIPNKSDVVVLEYTDNSSGDDFTIWTTYTGTSFTPDSITESPDGNLAYVTNTSTDVIDQFDDSPGKWSLDSSTISLSSVPSSIVSASTGMLYVALPFANDIAIVNTAQVATPSVTYSSLSSSPGPLALNSDASILEVASDSTNATEFVNSATGGTAETASSLPNTPSAIAAAPTTQTRFFAYVANTGSGTVSVVDTITDSVVTVITVGTDPEAIAVAPDNSAVFVANYGSNSISVMDPADILTSTNPVVDTITLASGTEPNALAISPSGTALLVTEYGVGQVQVIDTNPADSSYLQVVTGSSPIDLNGSGQSASEKPMAIAFTPSGQYAYVTDNGASEITVLVQSSATGGYGYITQQAPSGLGAPSGIAISQNGTTAYVSDDTNSKLWAMAIVQSGTYAGQLESGTQPSESVGTSPSTVVLSPRGTSAYVTNSGSNSVSVVPLSPLGAATTNTAASAYGAAMAPDGSLYLVAKDATSGSVSMWSPAGTSPISTVSVGSDPSAIAFGQFLASTSSTGVVADPVASELQGGATNPSEAWQVGGADVQQTSGLSSLVSDGVNTSTGDYSLRIEDLDIPDLGPGLNLSQTYNSGNAGTAGPLGYGWSFSYGMTLSGPTYSSTTGTCSVTISQGDGSSVSFYAQSTGTCPSSGYVAPDWVSGTLAHQTSCNGSDACYNLVEPDGTKIKFDAVTDQLFEIVDRDSNAVTFTYTSGQLSTVTAPSGSRSLSFSWSSGHVSFITDSLGREVAFGYDGSGDLDKITMTAPNDPTTHYLQFSYNTTSHLLDDWLSPVNDATGSASFPTAAETATSYDSSNRATSVSEPQRSCVEGSSTTTCNPEWSFDWQSFNPETGTGSVLVEDPNSYAGNSNGDVTLDLYVDHSLAEQVRGYGVDTSAGVIDWAMTSTVRSPATLLPIEQIDGNGNVTSTVYDFEGNPLTTTNSLGGVSSAEYNGFSEQIASIDPMGNETTYAYSSTGDESSDTDPIGNVTSWSYGSGAPAGKPHTMTNALTGVTTYGYDSAGDLTSVEDPDGDVTSSLFDAGGETCASLSASGYAAGDRIPTSCPSTAAAYLTVDPDYDFFGDILEQITPTNAAGGTWTFGYDADGNLKSTQTPDGQMTTYVYDAGNELLSDALPAISGASPTTSYTYDPTGNKVTETRPLGNVSGCGCSAQHTWTYAFDNLGRLTSSTDPQGNVTTYVYDANGNTVTLTPPAVTNSLSTTYTYNADNEVLTATNNLGEDDTAGYDAGGQAVCEGDANAASNGDTCPSAPTSRVADTTTVTYTPDGQVATVEDPLQDVTTYYYDADGNRIAVTNPEGSPGSCNPVTTSHCAFTDYFAFDTANRMTSMTTPPTATSSTGQTASYGYNADGDQKTTTDPLGQVTTTGYDGLDEVTSVSYTSTVNSTPNVTYSYTNEGNLYQMTDGTGTTTYTYDADQRVTQVQSGSGAVVASTYDADSNVTCIVYPGSGNTCSSSPSSTNKVVDYTYDHDDRLATITDWLGDVLTYTYNHDSVPQELSANSSAVTENTTYDAGGHATDLDTKAGSTVLLDLSYGYDADGNPFKETPKIGSTTQTIENFVVDADDRANLFWTGVGLAPPANLNYGDDGEIVQNGTVGSSQTMTYDEAGELCWAYSSTSSNGCSSPPSGSTSYSYDADGERTGMTPSSGNSQAYAWDATNDLICANTNGSSCSTSSPTSTTTLYGYNGSGLLASSTISSTTTTYSWDTSSSSPRLVAAGSTNYVDGYGGAPVLQINGSTSDLLIADPMGSIHGLVQLSSGSLQNKLVNYTDYDYYGNPSNAGGLTQSHTSINANWSATSAVGFDGSYVYSGGLDQVGSGVYDPITAQYLADLEAIAPTNATPYIYSGDNPAAATPDVTQPDPHGVPNWLQPLNDAVQLQDEKNGTHLSNGMAAAAIASFMIEGYCFASSGEDGQYGGVCPNQYYSGAPNNYGIAAWQGKRWTNLVNFGAKENNCPVADSRSSIFCQGAYVQDELLNLLNNPTNNFKSVTAVCSPRSQANAAICFADCYENAELTNGVCTPNNQNPPNKAWRIQNDAWAYSWITQQTVVPYPQDCIPDGNDCGEPD